MLNGTNILSTYIPNGAGFANQVVGSGSDGTTYWNLFNDESNSIAVATYATYATLDDMLNGTNILSTYIPNGAGFANQVVGSGAFFTPDGGNSGNGGGTVPEPPSVLLFGLGMLGLMWNKMRS
jgi:hypothetical protein